MTITHSSAWIQASCHLNEELYGEIKPGADHTIGKVHKSDTRVQTRFFTKFCRPRVSRKIIEVWNWQIVVSNLLSLKHKRTKFLLFFTVFSLSWLDTEDTKLTAWTLAAVKSAVIWPQCADNQSRNKPKFLFGRRLFLTSVKKMNSEKVRKSSLSSKKPEMRKNKFLWNNCFLNSLNLEPWLVFERHAVDGLNGSVNILYCPAKRTEVRGT